MKCEMPAVLICVNHQSAIIAVQESISEAGTSYHIVIAPMADKVRLKTGTMAKMDVWGVKQSEVDGAIGDIKGAIARWQHRYRS